MGFEGLTGTKLLQCIRANVIPALLIYSLSMVIVFIGVVLGTHQLLCEGNAPDSRCHSVAALTRWDGQAYLKIATTGYNYNPYAPSNITFFPLYPLLGRGLQLVTGLDAEWSLAILANGLCCASFVLFLWYIRARNQPPDSQLAVSTLLMLAFFPPGFFSRMCYSESTYLCLSILAFVGIKRNWPDFVLALIVGTATAARPVGIALLVPLIIHFRVKSPRWRDVILKTAVYCPIALSGLLLFMAYQWSQFGNAVAFAENQRLYRMQPEVSASEKLWILLSFEPLWSVYDPSSRAYWRHQHLSSTWPIFSIWFANPLYFLLVVSCVIYGSVKGWLDAKEAGFCLALLIIGYVARSYEFCCGSQGRFASVAFPAFFVMAKMLCQHHWLVRTAALGAMGIIFAAYTAYFVAWHPYF